MEKSTIALVPKFNLDSPTTCLSPVQSVEVRLPAEAFLADNDMGNARRMVSAYGDRIRYCYELNKWLFWDDVMWNWASPALMPQLAKSVVDSIILEATDPNPMVRLAVCDHAKKSGNVGKISGMIHLAQSEPGIPIALSALDRNPELMGVGNGVVDLRKGLLLDPDRRLMVTRRTPIAFNPNAECPTWHRFLDTIFNGDTDLINFMQKLLGYIATGNNNAQVLPIFFGTGCNGKSTLMAAIEYVLGDYACRVSTDLIAAKKETTGAKPELVALLGKRAAFSAETKNGCELDEATIKELTGESFITARPLYNEPICIPVTFKVLLSTNYKPVIRGMDHGIWRRILLIPFSVCISESERDPELLDKLKFEAEGILNWIISGAREYLLAGKLKVPAIVAKQVNQYKSEMDVFGQWLSERCVEDAFAKTKSAALYDDYISWCREDGAPPLSSKKFSMELGNRGFDDYKGGGGVRLRSGIKLRAD